MIFTDETQQVIHRERPQLAFDALSTTLSDTSQHKLWEVGSIDKTHQNGGQNNAIAYQKP